MKKTLIVVVGPTAIGKTTLAIALAKHFKTEILSADSRQFYKEMSIGTAVPTIEELQAAKHHFIQHVSIHQEYNVGDFERDAIEKAKELFKQHNIAILVGGSGLYVDAVTKGLDKFPKIDNEIRMKLNHDLKTKGITFLQDQLKILDPIYYQKVDLDNPHRLIRALEICIGTKQAYSSFIGQQKPERPFKVLTIGINADRDIIYDRINRRVDIMMNEGLLDEVKKLVSHKNLNALQTVGYREIFGYLDGDYELGFAISEIKKNTRRFAKRQLTWFRKNKETIWVSYNYDFKQLIEEITCKL